MSIVALKKKAAAQNKISGNPTGGFSLNGGHRSQGYVGQSNVSRSLPRTLMKGAVVKGSGGSCGKYIQTPIVSSAVISTEDPNIIKSSVFGTKGMIDTHYQWILRPAPFSVVKNDDNSPDLRSQWQHIEVVRRNSRNVTIGPGPCAIEGKPVIDKTLSCTDQQKKDACNTGAAKHKYLDSSDYTGLLPKVCNTVYIVNVQTIVVEGVETQVYSFTIYNNSANEDITELDIYYLD